VRRDFFQKETNLISNLWPAVCRLCEFWICLLFKL